MSNLQLLLATSENLQLARQIGAILNKTVLQAVRRLFADGEITFSIPVNLTGHNVCLIHNTASRPNCYLMELFLLLDTIKKQNPSSVTVVLSYLAYLRQDRAMQPGDSVAADLVCSILKHQGVTNLICLDPHSTSSLTANQINFAVVSALPLFVNYLVKQKKISNLTLVAPDQGVTKQVSKVACEFNLPFTTLDKTRSRSGKLVKLEWLAGEVAGRNCFIFDDVATSGRTLLRAVDLLLEHKASKVMAGISHALLTPEAMEEISNSALEFLLTAHAAGLVREWEKTRVVLVAGLIADQLRNTAA